MADAERRRKRRVVELREDDAEERVDREDVFGCGRAAGGGFGRLRR